MTFDVFYLLGASVTKRKSQTATNLYRRQSEKRQRSQRQPSTDMWAERTITPEEDEEIGVSA